MGSGKTDVIHSLSREDGTRLIDFVSLHSRLESIEEEGGQEQLERVEGLSPESQIWKMNLPVLYVPSLQRYLSPMVVPGGGGCFS